MARKSVEITNLNTSSIKVLSNAEMIELFKKYQSGDLLAKEELVNGNLKLVLSILKKYSNRTDNMDDLFQVGCIGLIKAIDNFDLSYELKLSTYACPLIEGEIKRYLRDDNALRVARSIKDLAYKILKLRDNLITIKGEYPTNAELAKTLGVSEFDIINAMDALREPVSMYEPIYNDGGDTIYLYDQLASHEDEYDNDMKLTVSNAFKSLKEREKNILNDRFIMGKTQMEIASELGISQAQISRIEKNAIKTLKKHVK